MDVQRLSRLDKNVSVQIMLVLIFCKESYAKFLPYCINSVITNVKDKISSIKIVSNLHITNEFETITDSYFWSKFDPNFRYLNLWESRWHRQQILKLNSDCLYNKDILIVDSDLLFLKPVFLKTNKKYNFFTSIEYYEPYFNLIRGVLGLEKTIYKNQSFITDFGIFNSKILINLKKDINKFTQKNWLTAVDELVKKTNFELSEYELYSTYVHQKYNKKINKIINPIDYKMYYNVSFNEKTPNDLLNEVNKYCKNYFQAIDIDNNKIDTSSAFLKINSFYQ